MIPGLIEDKDTAREVVIRLLEVVAEHPIKTAEGFRNAAIDGLLVINPLIDINDEAAINYLIDVVRNTILEGRMIDFGYVPNAMLRETSTRTRDVFEAGELQHPYGTWLGVSRWEGGMCGYLFAASDSDNNKVLAVELYGIAAPDLPPAALISEICAIDVIDGNTFISPIKMTEANMNADDQIWPRGANLLDPLVTFLRILSDASVPIVDVPAPEKLNKSRVAKGKWPIPAHTRVETRDYVSTYKAAVAHIRASKGGHHASPVPHWRRAHQRHLASGTVVPVRSSRVNWREQEELHRLFYRAPQKKDR